MTFRTVYVTSPEFASKGYYYSLHTQLFSVESESGEEQELHTETQQYEE